MVKSWLPPLPSCVSLDKLLSLSVAQLSLHKRQGVEYVSERVVLRRELVNTGKVLMCDGHMQGNY